MRIVRNNACMQYGAVRCGAVIVALCAGLVARASAPPYNLDLVDYLSSEPLTNWVAYPAQYSAVEVPGGAPGVAWVRTLATKRVKMIFSYPDPYEHDATVNLGPCQYYSASGNFPVTASPATFQVHFTPGGSATIEFDLTGIPNFVTLGNFSLPFECTSVHTGLGGNAGTRLYLTDSTPLGSPYGRQVPVWTDVLEDACLWATGQTGTLSCRWWCTFKLYHSLVFVYDPGGGPRYVRWDIGQDPPPRLYRLTRFFSDRYNSPSGWVNGDCQDVSTYLQIALSGLGVSIETRQLIASWPLGFLTNNVCPIGSDSTLIGNYTGQNGNPPPYKFGMHQPCFVSASGPVYDPVIAHWRDLSGAPYQNPPMNWPWPGYWQVDHRPFLDEFGSGFWGLTRSRANGGPAPPAGEPVPVFSPILVTLSGLDPL